MLSFSLSRLSARATSRGAAPAESDFVSALAGRLPTTAAGASRCLVRLDQSVLQVCIRRVLPAKRLVHQVRDWFSYTSHGLGALAVAAIWVIGDLYENRRLKEIRHNHLRRWNRNLSQWKIYA